MRDELAEWGAWFAPVFGASGAHGTYIAKKAGRMFGGIVVAHSQPGVSLFPPPYPRCSLTAVTHCCCMYTGISSCHGASRERGKRDVWRDAANAQPRGISASSLRELWGGGTAVAPPVQRLSRVLSDCCPCPCLWGAHDAGWIALLRHASRRRL